MLSLGRRVGEVIVITTPNRDRLEVHLRKVDRRRAVIGIVAPQEYQIDRQESCEDDRRESAPRPTVDPVIDWIDPRPHNPQLGVPCVVKCEDSTIRLATREETLDGAQWRDARGQHWSAEHPAIVGWKYRHEASPGDFERAIRFEKLEGEKGGHT